MRTMLVALVLCAFAMAADKPQPPKGEPWPGGVWKPDGKEYPKGSFNWIKQAEWDEYQKKLKAWEAEGAFAAVNAARAKRGLAPFVEDAELSKGAQAAAEFRAERLIQGHTRNDFSFLPAGVTARAAGCAAWPVELGWGSCCAYENWSRAGAGWAMGRDGKRYMHLFVK